MSKRKKNNPEKDGTERFNRPVIKATYVGLDSASPLKKDTHY